MFLEITLPTGNRVFVQQESIISVEVGKTLKTDNPIVTVSTGDKYVVTVDNEKNTIARMIGMRS
jgi:hypothetical protein